jgi:hypothetical protein
LPGYVAREERLRHVGPQNRACDRRASNGRPQIAQRTVRRTVRFAARAAAISSACASQYSRIQFGSLAEHRAAWDAWVETMGHLPVPASVETQVLSLRLLGDTAVLVHSIVSRAQTDAGEEAQRAIETIVFARQADGPWLGVHQHFSALPD